MTYDKEMKKAEMRLNNIIDKYDSVEKMSQHINLRTRRMTKPLKLRIWANVLDMNNFHDEARIAFDKKV